MTDERYLTRQTLLKRARDPNDGDAWEEFVLFYKPFISQILHKMNIGFNDFDDLVQDVLLKLWKGLGKYDEGKSKFRTWLTSVTRNTVISYFRSRNIRPNNHNSEQIDNHTLQASRDSELENIFEEEWRAYLCNLALGKVKKLFTGNAVKAFTLSQKGKSPLEIADQLGLSKESVPVLTSRVRKRFVAELNSLVLSLKF